LAPFDGSGTLLAEMRDRNAGLSGLSIIIMSAALVVPGCLADDPDVPAEVGERAEQVVVQGHEDHVGTAFVHLFEWRWSDVAHECETFLGPKGFEAVQVSPPNEHIDHSTWWARYQPVSYQLHSRSGTREEFIDMVERCDAAGVAVYADAVINHTAAFGGSGVGVAGTPWSYKNHPMYGPQDYHATCAITDYGNRGNVQNCELVGLPDLDTGASYVQDTLAGYLEDLVDIGVAGFRIDAAKHMAHGDVAGVLGRAGNPYVFLEVIGAAGEAVQPTEYTYLGQVTEFGYSYHIGHRFKVGQIQDLDNIADGKLASGSAIVFVDNHDNQRGHGGGGDVVTYKDGSLYNLAVAFMLAHPYGYPQLMSSYHFTDSDHGPPAPGGCGAPGWVCEHRWTTIAGMVGFRNVTSGQPVTSWWDNGNNRIAFGRGGKGFIVINKESGTLDLTLQTGMPAGVYCNVAAGELSGGACTGGSITVDGGGNARFVVAGMEAAAIHVGAATGGGSQVAVSFTCENGTTFPGQSVYAVGSVPELGSWDPGGARKLDPVAYPTWTGTVSLPASSSVEWKCIKRNESNPTQDLVWEPGSNNVVATPAAGSVSTTGSF
jgi:alpha-amylase